jgi:microcystin-dependent protein
MGQPFIGECRLVGFNFPPSGWLMCQGQLISIAENPTLFQLIGTTYGGDGQQTFGMPDLQGRVPIHQGVNQNTSFPIGQKAGVETVLLSTGQLASHTHPLQASGSNGTSNAPQNNALAANPTLVYFGPNPAPIRAMNPLAITYAGGSLAHNNLQPYLTMTWVISLYGIFPSQS